MLKSVLTIGAVVALAACAADPAFVGSDAADSVAVDDAGATDTETTGVDATEATDTGVADATEVSDATDATDPGDVHVPRGCGLGCGPLAACVEDECACLVEGCTGEILTEAANVQEAVATTDANDQIAITYGRSQPDEVGLAIATPEGWSRASGLSWGVGNPLAIAHDADGLVWILRSGAESELFLARPDGDGWLDVGTGIGPCPVYDLAFDPRTQDLVILCVSSPTSEVDLFDRTAGGEFAPRALDPLIVGKDATLLRWGISDTGIHWVSWVRPVNAGEVELELAYLASDAWTTQPVSRFANNVYEVAMTFDRLHSPHLVVGHDDPETTDGLALTHAYYTDATHFATSTFERRSNANWTFGQLIAAAPSEGDGIQVLFGDGPRVVWEEVDLNLSGPSRVFQLSSTATGVALVANAGGRPTALVYGGGGSLRAWLPLGPYGL